MSKHKTAHEFLKSNGIVRETSNGIEVANNPNYYGLLHAMNEYAVYYAKKVYPLRNIDNSKNDGLNASHREEESPRNSGWSV